MKTLAVAVLLVAAIVSLFRIDGVAAQDAVAQGERIYDNYCATCHGEQLHNNSGGLTFDLRRLTHNDYSRFVNSVLNGKNRMPPWKGVLAQTEIDQLWAYISANAAR
jgi:mono/diheme cytochrome c family protein